MSRRTGEATHWDSRAYTRFFYGSNPRRETESGIKQRTLDTQDLQDLYTKGSQGVCFVLLDVGLSQLMPNTRQLDRFFPCLQKLQNSHICSQRSKLVKLLKKLNTYMSIASQRTTSQTKWLKTRTILLILFKIISFQDHCISCCKFNILDAHWLISSQR